MEKNNKITADQIRNMNDQEWNEFRNRSWLNKREVYSQDLPAWYLRDKERFIQSIEKISNRFKK